MIKPTEETNISSQEKRFIIKIRANTKAIHMAMKDKAAILRAKGTTNTKPKVSVHAATMTRIAVTMELKSAKASTRMKNLRRAFLLKCAKP